MGLAALVLVVVGLALVRRAGCAGCLFLVGLAMGLVLWAVAMNHGV